MIATVSLISNHIYRECPPTLPLHTAVADGNANEVASQLEAGCSANVADERGMRPLAILFQQEGTLDVKWAQERSDILHCLTPHITEEGVRPDHEGLTPLHLALDLDGFSQEAADQTDYLDRLFALPRELLISMSKHPCRERQTPLHVACNVGYLAAVRKLLELPGVDPHQPDRFGVTPLECIPQNHPDATTIRELLQPGASNT